MFKKDLSAAPRQKLKSSVQRSLRQSLLTTYPLLVPFADEILPKKAALQSIKLPDRAVLYVLDAEPLFFETGRPGNTDPLLPHLRLVHRFPQAFPSIRIDRGAIRYVLGGATLMAPGLTSPGGRLPKPAAGAAAVAAAAAAEEDSEESDSDNDSDDSDDAAPAKRGGGGGGGAADRLDAEGHWGRDLAKGEPVVITAEGKAEACAVGVLVVGTREVKEKGKGPVVEDAHFLGDGLWRLSLD